MLSLCLAFKREAAEQKDKVKDDKEEKKRLEAEKKEQKEREKKEQEARKKFKVSEEAWNSVELAITPRRKRLIFGGHACSRFCRMEDETINTTLSGVCYIYEASASSWLA